MIPEGATKVSVLVVVLCNNEFNLRYKISLIKGLAVVMFYKVRSNSASLQIRSAPNCSAPSTLDD